MRNKVELIAIVPASYGSSFTCYLFDKRESIILPVKINKSGCDLILHTQSVYKETINSKFVRDASFSFSLPSTYETFRRALLSIGVCLNGINIYKYENGIFYTYLNISNKLINASFVDAICMSLVFNSDIYVDAELIKEEGIKVTKDLLKRSLI